MPQIELAKLSLPELKRLVLTDPGWAERDRVLIIAELSARVSEIGWLWDRVAGVDPRQTSGASPKYGTPNKDSMTYALRKAAGYSYP